MAQSNNKIDIRLAIDILLLLIMGGSSHLHISNRMAHFEATTQYLKQQQDQARVDRKEIKADLKSLINRLILTEGADEENSRIRI